jgi:hypothetical protein
MMFSIAADFQLPPPPLILPERQSPPLASMDGWLSLIFRCCEAYASFHFEASLALQLPSVADTPPASFFRRFSPPLPLLIAAAFDAASFRHIRYCFRRFHG